MTIAGYPRFPRDFLLLKSNFQKFENQTPHEQELSLQEWWICHTHSDWLTSCAWPFGDSSFLPNTLEQPSPQDTQAWVHTTHTHTQILEKASFPHLSTCHISLWIWFTYTHTFEWAKEKLSFLSKFRVWISSPCLLHFSKCFLDGFSGLPVSTNSSESRSHS